MPKQTITEGELILSFRHPVRNEQPRGVWIEERVFDLIMQNAGRNGLAVYLALAFTANSTASTYGDIAKKADLTPGPLLEALVVLGKAGLIDGEYSEIQDEPSTMVITNPSAIYPVDDAELDQEENLR